MVVGRSLHDGLVGDALDLGDLLERHALEMGVKSKRRRSGPT